MQPALQVVEYRLGVRLSKPLALFTVQILGVGFNLIQSGDLFSGGKSHRTLMGLIELDELAANVC
jgi:hypothetical protein